MSTIVTRAGKGSALTWAEADANFTNLNTDKIETTAIGVSVQAHSNNLDTFSSVAPTVAGLALLDDANAAAQRNTLSLGNVDNTSDATKDSAVSTLTNKTITSPKIKAGQFGDSATATNNFTVTAEAADGTMKLARGNAGATTQDIITVDAAGKVSIPHEDIIGFNGTFSGGGISTAGIISFTEVRDDGGCYDGTKFQPTVAGWYSVSCSAEFTITSMSYCGIDIKKNGVAIRRQIQGPYNGTAGNACAAAEVYLNGSSDYVEFYYIASPTGGSLTSNTFASAALLRKA